MEERDDNTDHGGEVACSGGTCDMVHNEHKNTADGTEIVFAKDVGRHDVYGDVHKTPLGSEYYNVKKRSR